MTRDFFLLAGMSFTRFKNKTKQAFQERPLVLSLLSLMAFSFWLGLVGSGFWILNYIFNIQFFGKMLAGKLVQLLLFMAVGLSLLSSLTTAISHFYLSRDLEFQFALPVSFKSWVSFRFTEVYLQSAWMLLVFAGPVLVYFLTLSQANPLFLLFGFLIFAVLCSFPIWLASLVCMVLVSFFPARRVHQVFLVLTITLMAGLVFAFRLLEPEQFLGPGGLNEFRGFLDTVRLDGQSWNPAVWVYNILLGFADGVWRWPELLKFGLTALGLVALFLAVAERIYRRSWDRALQSLSGFDDIGTERVSLLSRWLSHPRWSQECRELLLFFRDPSQWTQVFVLLSLLVIYLFSITKLPENPFGGTRFAMALGNEAFVCFVSMSVASRFVFTSMSYDGEALWLMKTVPDGWGKFVRGKLLIFGLPTLAFAMALNVGSGKLLNLEDPELFILAFHGFWDASFLILLALALGILYMNPKAENPLMLIVSPGGILYMAVGVFAAGLHVALRLSGYSWEVNSILTNLLGWPNMQEQRDLWWSLLLITFELMLLVLLLKSGMRKLRKGEL